VVTDVDMKKLAGATETAIIVPVPAVEAVVGPYRQVLDHSALWGVPAHVTVLYAFLPPERITEPLIEEVRACVSTIPAFVCAFSRVAWFGQEVVWLAPDPDAPFLALAESLWRRFPECPPYGGVHPGSTPHLTVGSTRLGDLAGLQRAAVEVAAELPIHTQVDQVRLIAGTDAAGSWHTVAEFALHPA
jgi:hypothetical protein